MARVFQTRRLLAYREPGNAIVEMALLAPIVGLLLASLGAMAIAVQAQLGLVAVAEEAALAATYAPGPQQAVTLGQARGQQVGQGYALRNGSLDRHHRSERLWTRRPCSGHSALPVIGKPGAAARVGPSRSGAASR